MTDRWAKRGGAADWDAVTAERPRAQSRGSSYSIPQGYSYLFTARERNVVSTRSWSAAPVRHEVSTVRSGFRFTLGLFFHNAA